MKSNLESKVDFLEEKYLADFLGSNNSNLEREYLDKKKKYLQDKKFFNFSSSISAIFSATTVGLFAFASYISNEDLLTYAKDSFILSLPMYASNFAVWLEKINSKSDYEESLDKISNFIKKKYY